MPIGRLQRTRESYAELNRDPLLALALMKRAYDASYNFGPLCWCNGLPVGVDLARCPAHPSRTLRRGPVGTTN